MNPNASWTFDPGVLLTAVALGLLYLRGWRLARGPRRPHPPGVGRLLGMAIAALVLVAALESPIDRLGSQLMVMHMVQHVLLLDLLPIAAILALTKGVLRPATRRLHSLERRAGPLGHPVFAVLLYTAAMWSWHVPGLYDAALRHPAVHALEHACFIGAGSLYWWHLLSPIRSRLRLGGMGPVLYMVSTKLLVGLLGVALAFAPDSLYPFYRHHPHYWGITPGQDQNLAGLVMALEQSIVMGVALVVLFTRMLTESEREARREERLMEVA